jgi:hypothetical protein
MNITLYKKIDNNVEPTVHTYFSSPLINAGGLFAMGKANYTGIQGEVTPHTLHIDCDEVRDAAGMFMNQNKITKVELNFSSLKNAHTMFANCANLECVECDFSELTGKMISFGNGNEEKSTSNMFYGCPALTTVNCNFSSLEDGDNLFTNNSNLIDFNCDLSSLITAKNFCNNAKLSIESLISIKDSIKNYGADTNKIYNISLGLGCTSDEYSTEINEISFKKVIDEIAAKGWTVAITYNGPAGTATTFNYCKKELANEVSATHKDNENNYYTLYVADNVINDKNNEWRIFSSPEEAEQSWGLEKLPEKEI